MRRRFRLLVADYDGTVTDAEKEGTIPGPQSPDGLSFVDGYLKDVSVICGIPFEEAQSFNARLVAEMRADPTQFCLEIDGQAVAPSCVDPYLRTGRVVRQLMDELGVMADSAETRRARDRMLMSVLYKYSYLLRTSTQFRRNAAPLFQALGRQNVHVVSNSDVDGILGKIRQMTEAAWMLYPDGDIPRVHGNGRKFLNFPDWEEAGVPANMSLPGLKRPVLLRRKFYFERLNMLRGHYKLEWGEILVVGDIFELDLALPLALGCTVAILRNEFTPGYEIEFLEGQKRVLVFTDLMQVAELFFSN